MKITQAQLKAQFIYALMKGWLPFFEAAATKYALPAPLLLAIASRESNMGAALKDGKGDFRNGVWHGYSLMQIDIGSFPEWCATWIKTDMREAIRMGAYVLRTKYDAAKDHVPLADLKRVAVAMYNAGPAALAEYRHGASPDLATTGRDYSADVLAREVAFGALLVNLQ